MGNFQLTSWAGGKRNGTLKGDTPDYYFITTLRYLLIR